VPRTGSQEGFHDQLFVAARDIVQEAIDETETMAEAARRLKLNRTHMYNLCYRLGIIERGNPRTHRKYRDSFRFSTHLRISV
jgi:ADP-dependent phosphofructokinase/glucokinase